MLAYLEELAGFLVFSVILVGYYAFSLGYFSNRGNKKAAGEIEKAKIKNRIAEIERLKEADAAGEDVHKPRRKSRRMQSRRR